MVDFVSFQIMHPWLQCEPSEPFKSLYSIRASEPQKKISKAHGIQLLNPQTFFVQEVDENTSGALDILQANLLVYKFS